MSGFFSYNAHRPLPIQTQYQRELVIKGIQNFADYGYVTYPEFSGKRKYTENLTKLE